MWHALKAECAYARPYLFGGLGLALGVATIVTVVFLAVGEDGPPPQAASGIRTMFLIMAPVIVSFIVQAYRNEERRARLLLAGPLTPYQLAGVTVLLPTVFFAIGSLVAGMAVGAEAWFRGNLEMHSFNMVFFVGGQIFAYAQMGLLAQEASAAVSQRRRGQAIAAWAAFGFAASVLMVLYLAAARGFLGSWTWPLLILVHVIIALVVMAPTVWLYGGRTDFTR